ncbi:MAG: N-acetylmuramoyl-L-alanine amidase [Bacillota bacterium]
MIITIIKNRVWIIFLIVYLSVLYFYSFDFQLSQPSTKPLADKRVIVIDPGHGGIDGGTNIADLLEKEISLEIGLKLKEKLESRANLKVIMTREEDTALDHLNNSFRSRHIRDLKARIDIINSPKADLFISLHVDYRPQQTQARGPMVLYSDRHPQNKVLATIFQKHLNELQASFPVHKPKKRYDLYVLKAKKTPGVIVEVGFLSNATDQLRLQQEQYQEQLVDAIYAGVKDYFSGFNFIIN